MRSPLLVIWLALPACIGSTSTGVEQGDAGATDPDASPGDADAAPPSVDAGPPRTAGCLPEATLLAEGEHTFTLEGLTRRYVVRLPAGYTRDRSWPVVLALHPNGSSITYWDGTSGTRNLRGVAGADAILIMAEAIDGNWRDYAAPPETWPARLETELGYVDTVLAQVEEGLCVRTDAIFAMGFSGGGSFAGVLACRRDTLRAFAAGGAVIYFDPADCGTHVPPAWITIGVDEATAERITYRDFFRDRGGCTASSTPTEPSGCVAYDDCESTVQFCDHAGGHLWPDFGTQAAWDFFTAQL